jgi:hypothetical protein
MSPAYPMNQFAPDYFQGMMMADPAASGMEIKPYSYVYNPPNNQLTANQQIIGDTVAIETDSDFYMFAWYISLYTGDFQVRRTDATGYRLESGYLNSGALSQASNDPTLVVPSHFFPAGSKILIDIQDLSGETNPLQLVFPGIKVYRINRTAAKSI